MWVYCTPSPSMVYVHDGLRISFDLCLLTDIEPSKGKGHSIPRPKTAWHRPFSKSAV